MPLPKYRAAAYEQAKLKRVVQRIARHKAAKRDPNKNVLFNGRVITTVEIEAQCETCPNVFRFRMTTLRHRFCPECKVARAKARDRGRQR